MDAPEHATQTSPARMEDAILALVTERGALAAGEIVTHLDLVATIRRICSDGTEQIERRHWSTPGADPHLSYGTLHAQAMKILGRLT